MEFADCNAFSVIRPEVLSVLDGERVLVAYTRRNSPGSNENYFIQALNPDNGTPLYSGNGISIGNGITDRFSYKFSQVPGSSDVYFLYGFYQNPQLSVQRINPLTGTKVWQTPLTIQSGTRIYTGGADINGDVVSWSDVRNNQPGESYNYDVFTQRILPNGTIAWTPNGKTVVARTESQFASRVMQNVHKESFITWSDGWRENGNSNIRELRIQKFDSLGTPLFPPGGLLVNSQAYLEYPVSIGQPDGGVILAAPYDFTKLIVQRLSRDGRLLWGVNGRLAGTLSSNIFTGGYLQGFGLPGGGAVVGLAGNYYNIYAAKLNYCENPPSPPVIARQYVERNTQATLTATGCNGVVNWYDMDQQQGVIVGTGPTFSFTATGKVTYYADCVVSNCASLTTGAGQVRVIIHSAKSGAWNQPDTWDCNCVPDALDKVVVDPGHTVTLPNSYTAYALDLRQEGVLQLGENSVLRLNE